MSRGLGIMQRFVLDVLQREHEHLEAPSQYVGSPCWATVEAMAKEWAGGRPTRAQVESIRRAARTLEHRGLAVVRGVHFGKPGRWEPGWKPGTDWRTAAHLPLSVGEGDSGRHSQHLEDLERQIAAAIGGGS